MGDGEGWLEMVTAGSGEEEGLNVGDLKADVADWEAMYSASKGASGCCKNHSIPRGCVGGDSREAAHLFQSSSPSAGCQTCP